MDEVTKKIYQMIVPTDEEMERVINKLKNEEELTFDDIVVIDKMRWVKTIIDSKNVKI